MALAMTTNSKHMQRLQSVMSPRIYLSGKATALKLTSLSIRRQSPQLKRRPSSAIQWTPCDLQSAVKNLTFMVVYGTAMPTQPGDMHHGQEIPSGYARVGVE